MKLYDFELTKKGDAEYELKGNHKGVPITFFAEEKLLSQLEKEVFIQAKNVSELPGLVNSVCIMPDAHSGYGAPIGTVFAMDSEKGYVSPGAVGYDINCLSPKSEILCELGYRRKIKEFNNHNATLSCINFSKRDLDRAEILFFLKKKANPHLIKITTSLGEELKITEDHPLYTVSGMKEARKIKIGDKVAIYSFKGVSYEEPKNKLVLSEKDFLQIKLPFLSKYRIQSIIRELKKRELLPLYLNSPLFPYLIKLIGYNFGDGTIILTKKTQAVHFYGKEQDLTDIISDVKKIGYNGRIYKRERIHTIDGKTFKVTEYSTHASSSSLALLLFLLGTPMGNKTQVAYRIPKWLKSSPLWYKRLFLASFFGAEMSTPSTMTNLHKTFYMPTISLNKTENMKINGFNFLKDIKKLLSDLGIKTSYLVRVSDNKAHKKNKIRLRLQIDATNNNLINFYSKINFEYNKRKRFLANAAISYLKLKEKILSERERIAKEVKRTYIGRGSLESTIQRVNSSSVNRRFIERSIFEGRKTRVRIPQSFFSFKNYLRSSTKGLGKSGAIWDQIIAITKIPFKGEVYDLTLTHRDHNFIADSFVVSNCGMRLIRTNLSYKDIQSHLEKLVNTLFNFIPAGVGRTGFLKVRREQLRQLTENGVSSLVKTLGIGWQEDISHIEENGAIKGADFSVVSKEANERGIHQLGTLGSGNHYLEIQKVEEIFEPSVASRLGISTVGQIVVMVHCGSRGFGHQVCSDYLRIFEKHLQDFKIHIQDRQLACAPIDSTFAKNYLGAMAAAANFAFVNREAITHQIRKVFEKVLGKDARKLEMDLIYDVAHNIAKFEKGLLIHRKGATRSFPNQPVIIGGSMETGSFLLVGTEESLSKSFGSTAHGSGRTMSRARAKRLVRGETLWQEMKNRGIYVKSASFAGLAEEAGKAYKNINDVVKSIALAKLSKPVAYLKPVGNIKG